MKRILTDNLKRSADQFPDRLAFKQLQSEITYSDLVGKSNQVARHLQKIGNTKGDRVGIFMNRAIESCYAVYGILAAGCVYVPIDTNLPTQRILTLINDCDISTIITTKAFKKQIKGVLETQSPLKHIIGINDFTSEHIRGWSWDDIFSLDDRSVDINNEEDDNAYIIYTSGTTGHPKGIVHTHYSGGSYAKLSADLYQVTHTDILGNHSHLHYDISTMGYLTMPLVGACTYIVPEAYTMFPTSLAKLIAEEQLTIWYSVPLALIQIMQAGGFDERDYSALRWILYGGESFALKHVEHLRKCLPSAEYSNVYGPAEVNQCTYYNYDKDTVLTDPIPIGSVWPETDIILDEQGQSGEFLVASSTQMKEYWNRPERTQAGFISQTDKQGKTRRYYRTGDVGSINPDGNLKFGGRRDRQVKVRGYRVELNEVENVLLKHEDIEEVAVYAIKEADANVIYAKVKGRFEEFDERSLKKYLSNLIPLYSIPQEIEAVENIPRTTAGKIDYKALIQ
jgi:amino acid adenylation domain-containing protein